MGYRFIFFSTNGPEVPTTLNNMFRMRDSGIEPSSDPKQNKILYIVQGLRQ